MTEERSEAGASPEARAEADRRKRQGLGGSYLSQAIEELRASGSSDRLYPRYQLRKGIPEKDLPTYHALLRALGRPRRAEFARSCILYSILAAEAYANQYLQWHLSGEEFNGADKLRTFDKFVLGPRIVAGESLLQRGSEPAQTLQELLALRSRLVHPKLGPARTEAPRENDPDEFTPIKAARYLVAVADAVGWLLANSKPPHFEDLTVAAVDLQRQYLLDFAQRATDAMPQVADDPAPDLEYEVMQLLYKKTVEQQSEPGSASEREP